MHNTPDDEAIREEVDEWTVDKVRDVYKAEAAKIPPKREQYDILHVDCTGATLGAKAAVQYLVGCARLLLEKNKAYGDSALNPVRCFSSADAAEQIRVRLDDKLSRLSRGDADAKANIPEDTRRDIVNYLALLYAAETLKGGAE